MIPSQMLKGTLEGCILEVIHKHETYGYEISQMLKIYGFGDISEGTIYPILLRLEKNNLLITTYRQSNQGPKRKYYRLSESGEVELEIFRQQWSELANAVTSLLTANPKGDDAV